MQDRAGIVEFPCDVERLANGNTLITDAGDEAGHGSEIVEVNRDGEIVWRYGEGLRFAHSAARLPDGRTLIADTTNDRIIEVDADGHIVFTSDEWRDGTGRLSDGSHLHYPNDARPLSADRFLVTDRNNDRVIIVTRDGRLLKVWGEGLAHPHAGALLPNGHLLVADSDGNAVVQYDADGRVVWRLADVPPEGFSWPRDADRLENGHTLIVDSKHARVVEVTPTGEVVWTYAADYFANFYDAERLVNGHTLISSQQHQEVIEVNPAGEVVWRFRNYERPTPIQPRLVNGSFREVGSDGVPLGWILARRFSEGGGELIWTQDPRGRRVAGLAHDRDGALCLQQTIAVEPGRRYTVDSLVRTAALDGIACVQLAFLDEMNGLLCDVMRVPKGAPFFGDTPWTRDSFEAPAPAEATAADVRLFVTGRGRVFASAIHVFS